MQAFPSIATAALAAPIFTALAARGAARGRHGRGAPDDQDAVGFWSCLVVHALALPVGILVGYRRR